MIMSDNNNNRVYNSFIYEIKYKYFIKSHLKENILV